MSYQTNYEQGQHNMVCRVCCSNYKSREMRKNWLGFWCCQRCWEPRPEWLFRKPPVLNDPRPAKDIQGPDAVDSQKGNI